MPLVDQLQHMVHEQAHPATMHVVWRLFSQCAIRCFEFGECSIEVDRMEKIVRPVYEATERDFAATAGWLDNLKDL